MTTVVWMPGKLYADSQSTFGGRITKTQKLVCKTTDFFDGEEFITIAVAVSGHDSPFAPFMQWLGRNFQKVRDGEIHFLSEADCGFNLTDDTQFVIAFKDVGWRTEGKYIIKIDQPYWTNGSGSDFAAAAIHCGCDAREAIYVARDLDPYTGGDILEWRYKVHN